MNIYMHQNNDIVQVDSKVCLEKIRKTIISNKYSETVITCVGTELNFYPNNITHYFGYDNIGPLIGSILSVNYDNIYGTLEYSLNYTNLDARKKEIKEKHPSAFIIAVDAALGTPLGIPCYHPRPLKAGSADKKPILIGDCCLLIPVTYGPDLLANQLSSPQIVDLAHSVAEFIDDTIKPFQKVKEKKPIFNMTNY